MVAHITIARCMFSWAYAKRRPAPTLWYTVVCPKCLSIVLAA